MAVVAVEGDFKGSPIIILYRFPGDRFPMSFGIDKAKLILSAEKEIREFLEKNRSKWENYKSNAPSTAFKSKVLPEEAHQG